MVAVPGVSPLFVGQPYMVAVPGGSPTSGTAAIYGCPTLALCQKGQPHMKLKHITILLYLLLMIYSLYSLNDPTATFYKSTIYNNTEVSHRDKSDPSIRLIYNIKDRDKYYKHSRHSIEIRNKYSDDFFHTHYLVSVVFQEANGTPALSVMDISDDGVITIERCKFNGNTARNLRFDEVLIELPNYFKPDNWSVNFVWK